MTKDSIQETSIQETLDKAYKLLAEKAKLNQKTHIGQGYRQAGAKVYDFEAEKAALLNKIASLPLVTEVNLTAVALRPGEDMTVHGYYEESQRLFEYAEKRVITSLEDNKAANDDLVNISYIKKQMEAKKKEYLNPLLKQVDAIRDTYNYLMAPILEAERTTKRKMLDYDAEQRRIRAAQEEINRKRLEAAQEEMALAGELSESVNLVEVQPEISKRVSTDMGSSGITTTWKFEVIDFSLLPDRFKMENATLIGKVVRAGEREIPGVKIWSEGSIRVTAR